MRTPQGQAREREGAQQPYWKGQQRAREAQQGIAPVSAQTYRGDREKVRKHPAQLVEQRGLG